MLLASGTRLSIWILSFDVGSELWVLYGSSMLFILEILGILLDIEVLCTKKIGIDGIEGIFNACKLVFMDLLDLNEPFVGTN